MKSRNRNTLLAITTLGILVAVGGCALTGNQRSTQTGVSMQAVEQDISRIIAQADATEASLEDLVKPGQPDVKKAFDKYSANVDDMESLEKRFFEHADKMSTQGKEYFAEWQVQGNAYTNPQIQALSEQRRADLSASFVQISESSVGVKGAFKSYMSDIREIQTYLSNDLTPKGVEAITPVAHQAIADGSGLKEAVHPVLSAIGQARAEMAQGGNK